MEQVTTGLRFEECGIASALKQHSLAVPLNQRSYAWTSDKVEDLFNDLRNAFDSGEKIYFLGTIVLTIGPDGQFEVADGQQRLATISILIAAIRDFFIEIKDTKGATKCQEDYLLEYDLTNEDYREKLRLNYEDADFFKKTILEPVSERKGYNGPAFASHARLSEAAQKAKSHIVNITAAMSQVQDKRNRLIEWLASLNNNARVIVITVPGKIGNAFKMFETLNARGMEASQTDILKNFLFDKGQKKIGEIHPHWISMLSTIEALGDDELLKKYIRHYWIAHNGPTTERELGDKFESSIRSERQALDLVTALDSFAVTYVALHTPRDHPQFNDFSMDTRNCIYTITRDLRVEQILPLLLAIAKYLPLVEAEKAFGLCLSWSVRFLIAGGGGGGVLDRNYGLRAKEISKGEITTTKELGSKMTAVVPNNEVFKSAFAVATVRRTNLARYYLRAIDLFQKGEPKPQFIPNEDTTAVNIEHILPVNPSADWNVKTEIAETYFKRLGNLVLLGAQDNVKIGNKKYDEKKLVFKKSPYIATKWVAKYQTWGPDAITDHQMKLAELAPKVWPI